MRLRNITLQHELSACHHWLFLLVLAATLLSGCAFNRAVDRGHAMVEEQRYRAALEAYEQAAKLDPESKEAKTHVSQITPYAAREADAEARTALAAGKYEQALKLADYVRKLDPTLATALVNDVRQTVDGALRGLIAEEKMDQAYPFAIRARRLFPAMANLNDRFAEIRKHYIEESERLTNNGHYADAIDFLAPITKYEPRQSDDIQERRKTIRERWATSVRERAKKSEADGHNGVATALFARAHEIAAQEADAAAVRRLAPALRQQGSFVLAVEDSGDEELKHLVRKRAEKVHGVRWPQDDEGATMMATLSPSPANCSETVSQSMASKDYIAGTRTVKNPRYTELSGIAQSQHAALDKLDATIHTSEQQLSDGRLQLKRCKQHVSGPAADRLLIAKQNLAEKTNARDELRARIERLEKKTAHPPRRRHRGTRRLALLRIKLSALEKDIQEARHILRRAESSSRSAQSRCASAERAVKRAATKLNANTAQHRKLARSLRNTEHELAITPALLEEDVIDTFHYPVQQVTRKCTRRTRVELQTAWGQGKRQRELDAGASTSDRSHAAYRRYGISEDPLLMPLSDDKLTEQSTEQLVARVVAAFRTEVRDYYRYMADRTFEWSRDDEQMATDVMVAIYIAAPEQIAPKTRQRFLSYLQKRYGLQKLATLRI